MRTSALFCAKIIGFFEIYGVSTRTGGELRQCGHFADKGQGGSISRDFVRMFFIDGPLLENFAHAVNSMFAFIFISVGR